MLTTSGSGRWCVCLARMIPNVTLRGAGRARTANVHNLNKSKQYRNQVLLTFDNDHLCCRRSARTGLTWTRQLLAPGLDQQEIFEKHFTNVVPNSKWNPHSYCLSNACLEDSSLHTQKKAVWQTGIPTDPPKRRKGVVKSAEAARISRVFLVGTAMM